VAEARTAGGGVTVGAVVDERYRLIQARNLLGIQGLGLRVPVASSSSSSLLLTSLEFFITHQPRALLAQWIESLAGRIRVNSAERET
jgi:hypothetical protein